jgi:hypothetical protein
MRTKVIIDGLNNTQKFRAVINGVFVGDCQVKDLMGSRFPQREQRVAVWNSLMEIALRQRHGLKSMTGFSTTTKDGIEIQVDLV